MFKNCDKSFFKEVAEQLAKDDMIILNRELYSVIIGSISPQQWCQDMMLFMHISQEKAASFLREKGIEVDLLPEPEVYLEIRD